MVIVFILLLSGPVHPSYNGVFLSPCRIWYVPIGLAVRKNIYLSRHFRRKSPQNLLVLELYTLHTMNFM